MSVPHHRTKGPVSTPAARLIELQGEITWLQNKIAALEVEKREATDRLNRFYRMSDTSFGGIAMAQQWADLWMWEAILNENPQLKAIFEIGTWKGGFSWWLYGQARAREIEFRSYDSIVPEGAMQAALEGTKKWSFFVKSDVFADADTLGIGFRAWEPCVVFCDGGNKPRELRTFAEQLEHPESLLIVHDWGTEFTAEDVPASVRIVYEDFCESLGAISRIFRLKDTDA